MVITVASQQEGPGFECESGCFCVEFACSPCVCVGSLRLLCFPPTLQKHVKWEKVNRYSKLPVSVNVSVDGCSSICEPCDELATCPATVSF